MEINRGMRIAFQFMPSYRKHSRSAGNESGFLRLRLEEAIRMKVVVTVDGMKNTRSILRIVLEILTYVRDAQEGRWSRLPSLRWDL